VIGLSDSGIWYLFLTHWRVARALRYPPVAFSSERSGAAVVFCNIHVRMVSATRTGSDSIALFILSRFRLYARLITPLICGAAKEVPESSMNSPGAETTRIFCAGAARSTLMTPLPEY